MHAAVPWPNLVGSPPCLLPVEGDSVYALPGSSCFQRPRGDCALAVLFPGGLSPAETVGKIKKNFLFLVGRLIRASSSRPRLPAQSAVRRCAHMRIDYNTRHTQPDIKHTKIMCNRDNC